MCATVTDCPNSTPASAVVLRLAKGWVGRTWASTLLHIAPTPRRQHAAHNRDSALDLEPAIRPAPVPPTARGLSLSKTVAGRDIKVLPMRLPFFNPRKDEVAAIATDLITRFGLRAHGEAAHLAELSLQMGSRRKRMLYEMAAREIDSSFREARRQRNILQSATDLGHLGGPVSEGNEGGSERPGDGTEPDGPALQIRSWKADILADLVTELNRVDPSPRRARPLSARLRL